MNGLSLCPIFLNLNPVRVVNPEVQCKCETLEERKLLAQLGRASVLHVSTSTTTPLAVIYTVPYSQQDRWVSGRVTMRESILSRKESVGPEPPVSRAKH